MSLPHFQAVHSRREFLLKAGGGFGSIALTSLLTREGLAAAATSLPSGLTAREVEVLRLLSAGLTNAQIAAHLVVSPTTINAHLRSIYNKLDVTSRSAATRFAVEQGLA